MIHIESYTNMDAKDDEGRRLPPYVRCWSVCDLCKQSGPVVYGDTDWDKGSARAKAEHDFVFSTTGGNARSLCKLCRTVRIVYEDKGPDDDGKRTFFVLWKKSFDTDENGRRYPEDDKAVHVREFGQIFKGRPGEVIKSWRDRKFIVVEEAGPLPKRKAS